MASESLPSFADLNLTLKDKLAGAQITDGNRVTLANPVDIVEALRRLRNLQCEQGVIQQGGCGVRSIKGSYPRHRNRVGRGRRW